MAGSVAFYQKLGFRLIQGAQFSVTTDEVLRLPAGNDERSFPVRTEGSDVLVELDQLSRD